ncbi:hypothetical protein FKV70_11350 [Paenibacillus ottowii]|uniref:Uncharacterized protein n=1 Tax=Paenibacillus ottowii TaxID=2315729 RepID=A0ABY3B5D2_9BACL|nr:hypothetical protein FKV70_11350 [Paenibacillus ottowii]
MKCIVPARIHINRIPLYASASQEELIMLWIRKYWNKPERARPMGNFYKTRQARKQNHDTIKAGASKRTPLERHRINENGGGGMKACFEWHYLQTHIRLMSMALL